MAETKLANLINPQVMADMISAKVTNALVVTPYAKIDTTLVGRPGDTITVPYYSYIGDASTVAEAGSVTPVVMSVGSHPYKVAKAMQAVTLTDEAVLSGYGNPVGEANAQLAKSIAAKIDADCMAALLTGTQKYTGTTAISYNAVVEAIDVFAEEKNTEKVMFVNPAQVTALRKDTNFISADKYQNHVMVNGEIGMIANCRVVPSRQIAKGGTSPNFTYSCPIVKIEADERTEDEIAALTIYMKRDTNVETERHTLNRTTDISVDKHYVAALTNDSKVVVATFKA